VGIIETWEEVGSFAGVGTHACSARFDREARDERAAGREPTRKPCPAQSVCSQLPTRNGVSRWSSCRAHGIRNAKPQHSRHLELCISKFYCKSSQLAYQSPVRESTVACGRVRG
jgi:hypothetical protein